MNLSRSSIVLGVSLLIISVFSGTVLGQAPEKPKRNLLFIGQANYYFQLDRRGGIYDVGTADKHIEGHSLTPPNPSRRITYVMRSIGSIGWVCGYIERIG